MSASFFTFFALMVENPALTVSVLLTLAVLVVNGWTDAPNAIAGAVVTGALSFRRAVALAAVCNFLGVLCVTAVYPSVVETIYSIAAFGGGPRAASLALCAAMGAVVLWAAAWWWGIPTSESHALAAGLSGAALALEGSLGCIRWQRWGAVLLGLVLSVAAGLWAGRQTERLTRRWPLSPKLFRLCQIPGAAGTALGGRRIIDTVGREMVSLGPREGFSADLAGILCLLAATLLGLPVSTTHTRTAALLGVGAAGPRGVDRRVVRSVLLAWLATFPGCMALGYVLARAALARWS